MTARRFPVTDIQRAVQDCLSTAPRVVDELERLTGYAASSIRVCLARLEASQLVWRERHGIKRAAGYYYLWHSGPAPKADTDVKPQADTYEPVNRRDDLVTALFGPARKGEA
jgi:predicted transcriptional regulator